MPRIIPVLDVRGGVAVHARGGHRDDYAPLRSRLRPGSDPILLAEAVRDVFGLRDLYLADLDAIAGLPPSVDLYRALVDLGIRMWVDPGLRDGSMAVEILATGVTRAIVGLETVDGPEGLHDALRAFGPSRLAFSLDLRDGHPIATGWREDDPFQIAATAIEAGIETVILLDLARVGLSRGVGTLPLLRRLSEAYPTVEWVAGGGVAGIDDLDAIGRAGGSAALVASALHDGRILLPPV